MAYQSLTLTGGANTVETPALNQAGIASAEFVRFKPDPNGKILVEKLGGWGLFYAKQVLSYVRALLAWEDTNANKWLAYGTATTTNSGVTYGAQLTAAQCFTNVSGITTASTSVSYNLTPNYLSDNVPVSFQTTAGSASITVTDIVISGLTQYDSLYLTTPVSVAGLILSGQYTINVVNGDAYFISAANLLGNAAPAAYTTIATALTVTGGTYTAGSPSTLQLTYATQSSAPFITGENVNVTGVSPISWNGSGIVTACTTTSVTITAPPFASGSYVSGGSLTNYGVVPVFAVTSGSNVVTVTFPDHGQTVGSTFTILNPLTIGGVPLLGNYYVATVQNSYTFKIDGPSLATATATAYANSSSVTGGSSTTTAVTLNFGNLSYTEPVFTVTGGSSTTSHVTLSWTTTTPYYFNVGDSIYVSGVNPSAWNGTFVLTSVTSSSVTYALSGSALSWVSGGTVQNPLFDIGAEIQVSSISPSAWQGVYTVTNSTPTSVTYALSGSALSWASGGLVSQVGGQVGAVYNISSTALPPGSGWGIGGYGNGGWGIGTSQISQTAGQPISSQNWALDNWGEVLLAAPQGFTPIEYPNGNVNYGPIYAWDPTSLLTSPSVLSSGPPLMNGFFVAMPQRQIISWGSSFGGVIDPLLIRWCDVSNYNTWVAQITNQAGSYRLSTGSAIIGAMQTQQQGLVWTDVGLWSMQYIGTPYVYSFNQIGQGCGMIARRAAGVLNGVVYWMGYRQFFAYNADGVQPIPCPIWDTIFQDIDLANLSKIVCAVNSLFEEITWYYPSLNGTGENSAYVRYNALVNQWDMGTLDRSAWIDNSVLGPPIGYSPVNGSIYQHEISPDANGVALTPSFTTGYFAIAEGQAKAYLDEVWPDFKWGYYNQVQNATVQITFNACDFPGQTPTTYGPYSVTQATQWFNPRFRARLVSVTVSGNDLGTFWRMGALRYRVAPDGRY